MKVRVTDGSNGTTEFHNCGCSHDKGGFGYTYEIEMNATNLKELCHELELWANEDFASDYGMTVEDYVASGEGYRVGKEKDLAFRVFPCIKF